jgi:histidine ammonia-lyase
MTSTTALGDERLTLALIREMLATPAKLVLTTNAQKRITESRSVVERLASGDTSYYGINTGFGILAHKRISPADVDKLQENLILSHAVGVGREVDA